MNNIELIKAEIKRRFFEDYNGPDKHENEIAQGVCAGLLFFINSLPEDKPSEDLEQEVLKYCKRLYYNADFDAWQTSENHPCIIREDVLDFARHFAQWQREQMIKAFSEKCKQEEIDPAIVKVIEDHWWEML